MPDRSKIDIENAKQVKYWQKKALVVSKAERRFHSSEGVAAEGCGHARGRQATQTRRLPPEDFPVNSEGKKIKKHDGTPIAETTDPAPLPMSLTASTSMKRGVKKTSGRLDLKRSACIRWQCVAGQRHH